MATFVPFNTFSLHLAEGVHDLSANQLMIALVSNASGVNVALDSVLVDITEIAYTNLLNNPAVRQLNTVSSAQTGGNYKIVVNDVTLEASGGALPAFRYVVVYNDSTVGKNLLGYYDYGADVTLAVGETLLVDFSAANGFLQFNWV